ncbi:hypothetical protein [Amycolatopsis sp. H20-H5]|uniref:hypothetical protein n=1 Tax=Amycolatopsis sp. H20-H5 TaxID=3046309 RepID=UPI002DBB3D14|nr:hypothetical protein [Amycolatopsis sp. H20-H5]MEC3980693.1 hypothetical protein [Amycolatopsis sp. H20-H5]
MALSGGAQMARLWLDWLVRTPTLEASVAEKFPPLPDVDGAQSQVLTREGGLVGQDAALGLVD